MCAATSHRSNKSLCSGYRLSLLCSLFVCLCLGACQKRSTEFISIADPVIALKHVRVIDGTGNPAREDQTIIIESGRIKAIGPASELAVPASATSLDLSGHTAFPGLVGMHDHLFYHTDRGNRFVGAGESFARLYLGSGVTTIRTAGAGNLDGDKATKRSIDNGYWPGPKIHLSSTYINHSDGEVLDTKRIPEVMDQWAADGVATLKVYTNLNRSELATVVDAAHQRGLKVTGHLCAAGFLEAAQIGIDNLEHGLIVDTEFYSAKNLDKCPKQNSWIQEFTQLDLTSPKVQELIRVLVDRRVAITSTLPVFETFTTPKFKLDPRMKDALTEDAYNACLSQIVVDEENPAWSKVWELAVQKEMQFEREFVKAGGLLMAGVDPTGWGGVLAGFGDQRGLELLVEAGFSPEEAIRIATLNGATFLGEADHIGTLAVGKQADVVIVRGNPSANIKDVRNVYLVFKDGVGYDSTKLIQSVHGSVGQ